MEISKEIVRKAYKFSREKHGDALDDEGFNYFNAHVLQVYKVIEMICNEDYNLQAAALLHDTVEDTDTSYEELIEHFGIDVADLVLEVTHEGSADSKGYFFPRLATHRGIILKFADRLSNLSRMNSWDEKRKSQYLRKSKFWRSE